MKLNSLLNYEPAPAPAPAPAPPEQRPSPPQQHFIQTTTYEAANALTTLATLGSGQQYAPGPARELPSPTAAYSGAPRRTSSFGSHHAPVEPSPPLEHPPAPSPTLEQYHHSSKSPEEQKRRQSLMTRSSPAPILAPIQNLSAALQEQLSDERPTSSPIGHDVSQIAPDEPATLHTRQPESVTGSPRPSSDHAPHSQPSEAQLPAESTIKNEPFDTPRASTPAITASQLERQSSTTADNMDLDTLKALEIAKQNDLGLRHKRTASVAESITSPIDPKPASLPSKKRPAPASASAHKKKGTAKALKPSKKRRIDTEDDSNTRSVTPTSRLSRPSKTGKRGSQAGTPGLESSPAPENSSQAHASDDDGESSEDHNLYCICRKPDNHKWMIGCDGGCDDWFHGDCVNMKQADEELVDRFICPHCEENGKGNTTWKPMCRRDGCRKPARLIKDRESKYCSEACGTLFMTEQLQRTAGARGVNGTKPKKAAKKKGGKADDVERASGDEEEPTPLGGILRSKDLKALVDASPNIQAFKNLGTGVLTPPQTASPNRSSFNGGPTTVDGFALTAGETERLNALHNEKSQLKDRLEVLKDREKFVSMAKEQAVRVADREKIKMKEFCGYDSRLSWSDAEFLHWRNGKHGRAAFKFSTLSPTAEQVASMPTINGHDTTEGRESACLRKRCSKHPQWQKLNLQDARFEELEVVEAIRECEKEEKSVRERARRRGAKDAMAKELTAGDGESEERNREGWVEVVAS
jgi:COMPASS component SPP1